MPVEIVDARAEFLEALRGLTDPEDKRNAITPKPPATIKYI
jgi:GMP synthase PP-ATPase subunit